MEGHLAEEGKNSFSVTVAELELSSGLIEDRLSRFPVDPQGPKPLHPSFRRGRQGHEE